MRITRARSPRPSGPVTGNSSRGPYDHGFAPIDADRLSDAMYEQGPAVLAAGDGLYDELGDAKGMADAAWGLSQAYGALREMGASREFGAQAVAGYRR